VNSDQADVYRMTAEEVVAGFGSDRRRGLSGREAGARLERYGPNELETEKPVPAWRRFLAQFQDVLIMLLLVATAISVGLWVYERDTAVPYEGLTIFAIVLLNGILGYVQEARAERAVAALRAMSANEATVLRDGEALRTLGVAFRSLPPDALEREVDDRVEWDLVFLGVVGMIDPPREEAKEAVARAKGAGIRPIMITGDHPQTAAAIARELDISAEGRAVTGAKLEKLDDEALERTVRECSVYARVNPEHKLRIVDALQKNGDVVAMTGDGVNDAPALKSADIGVAMGITGTDVSKEAADMVLTDDNFASIVAAVEEGRSIFANIQKFLRFLLSSNIGEVLTVFLGVVLAGVIGLTAGGGGGALVLPLLATQILWINLITDGAPALALGVDPADPEVMNRPPQTLRRRHAPHVVRHSLRRSHHGRRHLARARLRAARRPDRGLRRLTLRADDGLYHAGSVPALQRPQRPFGRAQRVPPVVPQPVAARRARVVGCAADPGRLRTVPATRVRYRGSEPHRLARVRCGRQLGPVAARGEQAVRLREIGESAPASLRAGPVRFYDL
jgi:magnesium-transporting ATPase (P-type)